MYGHRIALLQELTKIISVIFIRIPFYVNNIRIKQVHKTKYLALTVDDKLSWNQQYKSVKVKVAGGLASLRKLKNMLPQSQLLNVYQALVESHLRYANVVWEALSDTKLSTLQGYQDRAIDLIESSKIKYAYNENILNVNQLMTFDRVAMTFSENESHEPQPCTIGTVIFLQLSSKICKPGNSLKC